MSYVKINITTFAIAIYKAHLFYGLLAGR